MAELDERLNRLTVKLVYYEPALSGKTTNLTRLHDLLAPQLIGDMMTLETEGDRTLFFDLFPFGFTAPGQVCHDGTRKAVLSRADGVAFVADSQRNQAINNGSSFENLMTNIPLVGLDLAALPLVVQFNKRDLSDILTTEEIQARWSSAPWPLLFASALEGNGVCDTFKTLLGLVYTHLDRQFSLGCTHGLSRQVFVAAAGGAA